jgi:small subunit ribosomal protein S16
MLRIRLRRVGKKKQPSYRIVVAESTAPRDGKFVEIIGIYNPRTEPETVNIKEARTLHWLEVGAQPSESVARIFRTHGTMARFERLRAGESLEVLVAEAEAPPEEEAEEAVEAEEKIEEAEAPEIEPEPEADVEAEESAEEEEDVEEAVEAGEETETESVESDESEPEEEAE